MIILGVVLVALFFFMGKFFTGVDSSSLTGNIVKDPEQNNLGGSEVLSGVEDTPEKDTTTQEGVPQEDVPQEDSVEWYEYKGQCSQDIKNTEDDIIAIDDYAGNYEDEYNNLKKEYDAALQALNDQYDPKLGIVQGNFQESQDDLVDAKNKLESLKEQCAY